MKPLVTFVICLVLAAPAGATAPPQASSTLRSASRLSGLPIRHAVRTQSVSGRRYDALLARAVAREYPPSLQRVDTVLYARLGLTSRSVQRESLHTSGAWYDATARRLLIRRGSGVARAPLINELVRALVDQNFGLRRLVGLRLRDRDRAVAGEAIVDGTAALASRLRAKRLHGSPLDRFLQVEDGAGLGPGRALAAKLRYLGGMPALRTALRTFPQTTEQLLHIDKFLERERALPVRLPQRVGDARLTTAQTFGELDARGLLQAFRIAGANVAAAGWGGGRIGLYTPGAGDATAALVLRWDSSEDASEWRDAFAGYVAAAFPVSTVRNCPPLDHCWSTTFELAFGTLDQTTVFTSGPAAEAIAAALLAQP